MLSVEISLPTGENAGNLDSRQWFAVRVKSQKERSIATSIESRGFEEFLPVYQCRRRWSDRMKSMDLPLFPGYVFCRVDPPLRLPILTVPGVLHFVGIGRVPVAIEDAEMAAIQRAVRSGLRVEPSAYLDVGQRVRLEEGPLAGLEGILIEIRKHYRVVVSLSLLKRSVAVEIEHDWVTPLDVKPVHPYLRAITA